MYAVINGSVTPSSMTSVENISVASVTNPATLDLTNATGVTKVTNQGSATALTVAGIATTFNFSCSSDNFFRFQVLLKKPKCLIFTNRLGKIYIENLRINSS
jgi:hypothetical protein